MSSSRVGHLVTMTAGSSRQHREIAFLHQDRLFVCISAPLHSLKFADNSIQARAVIKTSNGA